MEQRDLASSCAEGEVGWVPHELYESYLEHVDVRTNVYACLLFELVLLSLLALTRVQRKSLNGGGPGA